MTTSHDQSTGACATGPTNPIRAFLSATVPLRGCDLSDDDAYHHGRDLVAIMAAQLEQVEDPTLHVGKRHWRLTLHIRQADQRTSEMPSRSPGDTRSDDNQLTPRAERFCQAYALDPVGSRAARAAGYARKYAAQSASKLLSSESGSVRLMRRYASITFAGFAAVRSAMSVRNSSTRRAA